MFERATTFWRPDVSDDQPGSEPLTPAEFKARRRVADQGLASLSGVLDEDANARGR